MGRRLCHRYGPGRLPYASRRDIGGGIAMAATGLLAAVLWFGGTWTLLLAGLESDMLGFVLVGGMFAFPVSIVSAFLIGTLCWRTISSETRRPFHGAILGAVTAMGSLIAGALGPAVVLAISNVTTGEMAVLEAIIFGFIMFPAGLLFAAMAAGWLILPLGVFGGWHHERAHSRT
ncbi:hypothetical protein G6M89_00120 [Natronolimnobius sp. AArcel1]|uniref:hypothetical protein n=1 Tax=Natronolimnobius sp. AArcel1 TaxID=1679093 RepID=UPI0013EB77C0|nr:hypothetical protein [Natronolimnobius sp. AArcel1]NGM67424.1 hypothetical protein [Natronolimnobius sp. AArcel1]